MHVCVCVGSVIGSRAIKTLGKLDENVYLYRQSSSTNGGGVCGVNNDDDMI